MLLECNCPSVLEKKCFITRIFKFVNNNGKSLSTYFVHRYKTRPECTTVIQLLLNIIPMSNNPYPCIPRFIYEFFFKFSNYSSIFCRLFLQIDKFYNESTKNGPKKVKQLWQTLTVCILLGKNH